MDRRQIARGNRVFYYVAVGIEMCLEKFVEAVLESFDKPFQYCINTMTIESHQGIINIDCRDIKRKNCDGSFEDDIDMERQGGWLLGKVAREIDQETPTGSLKTDIEIVTNARFGRYKFAFHISGYIRDAKHNFDIVDDALVLPDNEVIGHVVDLKITMVQ